jgi:polysaccharide export outer membrane protein
VFSGAPDLNQSQKIRPDGTITLPLIGEISAEGKTFAAFQQELEDKYKSQLKNSEVVISLESGASRSIIVDGAVRGPGSIPCDRSLTAFEAIMLAGGFSGDADMKKVQVIRLVHGEDRSMFLDLRGAMHGSPAPGVPVQAGDIIFVPEKMF